MGGNKLSEYELREDEWLFSTDKSRLDIDMIHRFIGGESYWAPGIARELVEKAIANSLCFGCYRAGIQVGYARVVTDFVGFAYLADVFVIREQRGLGVGKRLMRFLFDCPHLQNLRRFMLATRDAHGLYAGFGFRPLSDPQRFMERFDPDAYLRQPLRDESVPG